MELPIVTLIVINVMDMKASGLEPRNRILGNIWLSMPSVLNTWRYTMAITIIEMLDGTKYRSLVAVCIPVLALRRRVLINREIKVVIGKRIDHFYHHFSYDQYLLF